MNIETITAPNPGPFTLTGTKTYVLDQRVVIDPGPTDESHIQAILDATPHLEAILVTHRHADHAPGAVVLRQRRSCTVIAPPGSLDASVLDRSLDSDVRIEFSTFSIRAIPTPGHTAEHFCFLTDDGELFTGDTVLGAGTTVIFPPDGDMDQYLRSLERLVALAPTSIYPGHGPIRHDAVALLQQYIEHRLAREEQIVEALRVSPSDVSRLRAAIYPTLDDRLHRAAELQLEAHLTRLTAVRRVERDGESYRPL